MNYDIQALKIDRANSLWPQRVYFLAFSYAVGGGCIFYLRIIEYLLTFTNIKVGIIDF